MDATDVTSCLPWGNFSFILFIYLFIFFNYLFIYLPKLAIFLPFDVVGRGFAACKAED